MRVLVVDPNVAFATLLSGELGRLGYDVTTCHSGQEAYHAARVEAPGLALLDMALEDPDALTLARLLRALDAATRLMLIPMMGESPVLDADAPSIQGVLPKPFFLPELPDRMQAALDVPLEPGDSRASAVLGSQPVAEPPSESESAEDIGPSEPEAVAEHAEDDIAPPAMDDVEQEPPLKDGDEVISRRAFRLHQGIIESLMRDLAEEVGAEGVLLTGTNGLLTSVGSLDESEIDSIAKAVLQGWQTSAEVARILGREQVRFEQSIAGGSYLLYALSVHDAILALTVGGSAQLGLLRHRARAAGERIAELCTSS